MTDNKILNNLQAAVFSGFMTLVIMWQMLLPGYILTLDLVFTPFFQISHTASDFLNSLPLLYFIKLLYVIFPGWLVEKLLLASMFFSLSFFSFKYLPVPQKNTTKIFASLLYTANPFVYTRMLAGQWTHIYAYALLPVLFHILFSTSTKNKYLKIAVVLTVIGIFSLHLFLMSCLVVFLWILVNINNRELVRRSFSVVGGGVKLVGSLFILTSYWTIPALIRPSTLESQFTREHWSAFAAAGHGTIPVLLNLLTFNGFWAESRAWAQYFAWPQQHMVFWIAWVAGLFLAAYGIYSLYHQKHIRKLVFLSVAAIAAFILSTGAAATPFSTLNIFLYQHVPFWAGFRDSHKFIAFFAMAGVIFAGYGFDAFLENIKRHKPVLESYAVPVLCLIPIFLGMYVWGGFAKQLQPVQYPDTWYQARSIIEQHSGEQVLILPWQGYLSLKFNNNLIVSNPSRSFFQTDTNKIIDSQNFRLSGVYDQTPDLEYKALDKAIVDITAPERNSMAEFLQAHNISLVLYLQDIKEVDTLSYEFLNDQGFKKIIDTPSLELYTIQTYEKN